MVDADRSADLLQVSPGMPFFLGGGWSGELVGWGRSPGERGLADSQVTGLFVSPCTTPPPFSPLGFIFPMLHSNCWTMAVIISFLSALCLSLKYLFHICRAVLQKCGRHNMKCYRTDWVTSCLLNITLQKCKNESKLLNIYQNFKMWWQLDPRSWIP